MHGVGSLDATELPFHIFVHLISMSFQNCSKTESFVQKQIKSLCMDRSSPHNLKVLHACPVHHSSADRRVFSMCVRRATPRPCAACSSLCTPGLSRSHNKPAWTHSCACQRLELSIDACLVRPCIASMLACLPASVLKTFSGYVLHFLSFSVCTNINVSACQLLTVLA